jgi:hypothetical protein
MTGLRLHLTTRSVWPALTVILVLSAVGSLVRLGNLYRDINHFWIQVVVMVPLVAMVALVRTLVGDAANLERSTPRLRRRWLLTHAVAGTVLGVAPLALASAWALESPAAAALIRNVLGIFGVALLASTVVRAGLAWVPAMAYAVGVLLLAPHQTGGSADWWAWPVQPGGSSASWQMAVTLLLCGVTVYALRGPAALTSGQD